MNELPLSAACLSEVLARVSFRLMHRMSYRYLQEGVPPHEIIPLVADDLLAAGFPVLAAWCLAYRREWSPLTPTSFIKQSFIFRSRQGYTWRHVVYPQYKSGRCDPRVTNRGVARDASEEERGQ